MHERSFDVSQKRMSRSCRRENGWDRTRRIGLGTRRKAKDDSSICIRVRDRRRERERQNEVLFLGRFQEVLGTELLERIQAEK